MNKFHTIFPFTVLMIFSGCATSLPTYKERVDEKIKSRKIELRHCYESRPEPRKNGLVRVEFTYDDTGTVTEAIVTETTLKDPILENCVLTELKSIRFPSTWNGEKVHITYPFSFSSKR
jgi:TonB family protein